MARHNWDTRNMIDWTTQPLLLLDHTLNAITFHNNRRGIVWFHVSYLYTLWVSHDSVQSPNNRLVQHIWFTSAADDFII
jgi:hypothetical protein